MRVRTLELRLIGLVLAGCWVVAAVEVLDRLPAGRPGRRRRRRGRARAGAGRARRGRSGRRSTAAIAGSRRCSGSPPAACSSSSRRSPTSPASSAAAAPRRCCRRSRRPTRGSSRCIGTCLFTGFGIARRRLGAAAMRRRRVFRGVIVATVLAVGDRAGVRRGRDGQRARPARPDRDVVAVRPDGPRARPADLRRPDGDRPDRPAHSSTSTGRSTAGRSGRSTSPASATSPTSAGSPTWPRPASSGSTARRRSATDRGSARRSRRLAPGRARRGRRPGRSISTAFRTRPVARGPGGGRVARRLDHRGRASSRECRIAIDGPTFQAAFPQAAWLVGDADLAHWRGQLDYWVFLDGQIGRIAGSVNGDAADIQPGAPPGDGPGGPDRDRPRRAGQRDRRRLREAPRS